jgi:hypothetical protein
VAYAEFNSGLRFVRAEEIEANGLDMAALRRLATKNLTDRTRELRILGGGSDVVVICAEGNLEPSLILLDEVWRGPRARVDGNRLVTIAERGFAVTAGAGNLRHIWQLAADAAVSYRKAQYAVSPSLSDILCAGHNMRDRIHGYANQEANGGRASGTDGPAAGDAG